MKFDMSELATVRNLVTRLDEFDSGDFAITAHVTDSNGELVATIETSPHMETQVEFGASE